MVHLLAHAKHHDGAPKSSTASSVKRPALAAMASAGATPPERAAQRRAPVSAPSSARCGPALPCSTAVHLGSNRDGVLRGDGSSRSSVANCQLQLNEPRQGHIVRSVQVHAVQLPQPCPIWARGSDEAVHVMDVMRTNPSVLRMQDVQSSRQSADSASSKGPIDL